MPESPSAALRATAQPVGEKEGCGVQFRRGLTSGRGGAKDTPSTMIRDDYILAWIRRYVRWLLEIAGFIEVRDHQAALRRIDLALRDLLGLGPDSVQSLHEGEILARLTLGDPPAFAQEKCLVLAALLSSLGRVCAEQGRAEDAKTARLKSLHVMLGLHLGPAPNPLPEYAPSVDELVGVLRQGQLPDRTLATLVIYYERQGRFAKAEDALFDLLEAQADDLERVEMGLAFYGRLQSRSDDVLAAGDLPRPEVESGLAELEVRQRALADRGSTA